MNAKEYNRKLDQLRARSLARRGRNAAVDKKAAQLTGIGDQCNEHGVFTKAKAEQVASSGPAVAAVYLVAIRDGLWIGSCNLRSPWGGMSSLPSVWDRAHSTRHECYREQINVLIANAKNHLQAGCSAASKERLPKLIANLRALIEIPTTPTTPLKPMNKTVRLVKPSSLELHPEAALVPEMPAEQYAVFKKDVKDRLAIDEPLKLIPGTNTVIDGRTRLRAATDVGLALVPVVDADLGDDSPLVYMLRVAYLRRNLKPAQAAKLGNEIKKTLAQEMRQKKKEGGKKGGQEAAKARRGEQPVKDVATGTQAAPSPKTRQPAARDQAAAIVGASPRSIDAAAEIEKKAPEVYAKMGTGEIPTIAAAKKAAGIKRNLKAEPPVTKPVSALHLSHVVAFPVVAIEELARKGVNTLGDLKELADKQSKAVDDDGRLYAALRQTSGIDAQTARQAMDAVFAHFDKPSARTDAELEAAADGKAGRRVGPATYEGLLPCPFCGGKDIGMVFSLSDRMAECRQCKAAGPRKPSIDLDGAVDAWNKRPEKSAGK